MTDVGGEHDQRAMVADELALVRLGLTSILAAQGLDVVVETQSGRELAGAVAAEQPDLVVVGQPADLDLVDTVRRLSRVRPLPAIIALVGSAQDHVGYLLALGARGVALRSGTVEDLAAVVGAVIKGEPSVADVLHGALAGDVRPAPSDSGSSDILSAREREVLACLAQGRSNREIAATLSVSLATVKSHLVHVYAKLEAANRNEALGRAVSLGILK